MNKLIAMALMVAAAPLGMFAQQELAFKGRVLDEDTKEGVPFCNVYFEGTTTGAATDADGYYELRVAPQGDSLTASAMGYGILRKRISGAAEQQIDFYLSSSELMLNEVVVVAGENPANAIVRGIIKNKDKNRVEHLDSYQCEAYAKMELDLYNIKREDFEHNKLFKPFAFIFSNIDSISDEKPFLPAYMMERVSDRYFAKGEGKPKEIVKAQRVSGVENQTVVDFLASIHEEYDVYDNWIPILAKPMASPFGDMGLFYYEYYIMDSTYIDNVFCRKLKFKPKRRQENTFFGYFWVADSTFAIQRVDMQMGADVNINLVNRVLIYQEFSYQDKQQIWLPQRQKTVLDFRPTKNSTGLIGRKTVSFKDFRTNADEIAQFYRTKDPEDVVPDELKKEDNYWAEARHEKLSQNEKAIYAMIDSIKSVPVYKTYVDFIYTFTTGYKEFGSVEVGPYFNVYTSNPVEGHRFSMGVWTSNNYSKKLRYGGYVGYGLKDRRWKYGADVQWNLKKHPREVLKASYKSDVDYSTASSEEIGISEGNLFSGFYRRPLLQKLSFTKEAKVSYEKYWKKGWSNKLTILNREIDPYGNIKADGGGFNYRYLPDPENLAIQDTSVNTTEVIFKIRYAYKEKFLDGNFVRTSLGSRYPIAELQYTAGMKGLLGGNYAYHKFTLAITHWFDVKPFGWSRYVFKVGKTFGQVPFLLAEVHPGNETYFYSGDVFNGMNKFEFASDTYLSLLYTHHFDGYLLNKIPLLRKLNWREVAAFRAAWGSMNDRNLAANQFNLLDASLNGKDTYTGFSTLNTKPYMEAGVGIENIFKVFRVDAVWRLNYLDNPDARRFNLRAGMQFYF
jgi:hypothetical protein